MADYWLPAGAAATLVPALSALTEALAVLLLVVDAFLEVPLVVRLDAMMRMIRLTGMED